MLIRRKSPRALKLHEPIRHESAHKRPVSRRDFLSQSLLTGGATVVGPTLAGLLASNPALALDPDVAAMLAPNECNIVAGAGKIPFIAFDLAGQALRLVSTPLRDPPPPGGTVAVHFAAEDASIIPDGTH